MAAPTVDIIHSRATMRNSTSQSDDALERKSFALMTKGRAQRLQQAQVQRSPAQWRRHECVETGFDRHIVVNGDDRPRRERLSADWVQVSPRNDIQKRGCSTIGVLGHRQIGPKECGCAKSHWYDVPLVLRPNVKPRQVKEFIEVREGGQEVIGHREIIHTT